MKDDPAERAAEKIRTMVLDSDEYDIDAQYAADIIRYEYAKMLKQRDELLVLCEEAFPFVLIATCEHANQNEGGRVNARKCADRLKAALANDAEQSDA